MGKDMYMYDKDMFMYAKDMFMSAKADLWQQQGQKI